MHSQHFLIAITPPDTDDDHELVDAEQIARWISEHRPRHVLTVSEQS